MIFLTKKTLRGKRKSVSYHAIYGKIILQLDLQVLEVSEQQSLLCTYYGEIVIQYLGQSFHSPKYPNIIG